MGLNKTFATNRSAENEGIWVDVDVNEHDGSAVQFKIGRASMTNKKFAKESAKRARKFRGRFENMPPEVQMKATVEAFVDSVLLDWKNVIDYRVETIEGKPPVMLEFNRDNAIWLLNDLPDLFQLLTDEATNAQNFKEQVNAEEAKN